MSKINHYCYTCGTGYYYCSTCSKAHSEGYETWHIMFHDNNCRQIFDILQKHYIKEYSDTEAYRLLSECDLSQLENFKPQIKQQIQGILRSASVPKSALRKPTTIKAKSRIQETKESNKDTNNHSQITEDVSPSV